MLHVGSKSGFEIHVRYQSPTCVYSLEMLLNVFNSVQYGEEPVAMQIPC